MSEPPRRPRRSAPVPRRVGEPNVLSDQATPNRLSTLGTPGSSKPPAMAPTGPAARPAAARPTIATGRPAPSADGDAGPRPRRLPSLSTLLFIGFLVFTAARFLGNIGAGNDDPTTAPAPGGAGIPGVVTFGRSLDDDCALSEASGEFKAGEDVWWRADLSNEQVGDATVFVRMFRDEGQIARHLVPPEDGTGGWDVLCAGEPVPGNQAGAYRVEVWDEAEKELLAVGSYVQVEQAQ